MRGAPDNGLPDPHLAPARPRQGRFGVLAALLVACAAGLGAAAPAQAADRVLVSNLDQSASSRFSIAGIEYAQSFTTGRTGAVLSSIEVDLYQTPATPGNLTVSLWSADGSTPPRPLAHLHTLSKPALSDGLNTFSAPADTELAANTTYFIHLVDTTPDVSSIVSTAPDLTAGTADDGVSVSGWSIGDQRFVRERGETRWGSRSTLMRMKVNGTLPEEPRLTGVALDSAPAFGDTFVLGEHVDVKATFSASVEVTEPAMALNLSLWFGPGLDVWTPARYVSGSGTRELIFRRVVEAGDAAPVGFLIGGSALGSTTRIVSALTGAVVPTANLQNRGVRSGSLKVDGARGTLFCRTPAGAFWSACLKVGSTVSTAKGFTTGNTGVLSQPTVSHGGVSYRVIELLVGNDGSMGLKFHPLLRNAANWVLLVDDRTFAISDSNHPSGNTNTFEWSTPGLSWTVGQTVAVALGEKPGAAPTGLTATAAGRDRIALAWSAPAGSVSGYKVEVSNDGRTGWTSVATVTGTSYTHTGHRASTTRHYRVRATNNFGAGPASDTAQATTESFVKRITIASDPGDDGSYGPEDTITVRVEFAGEVCHRRNNVADKKAGIKLLVGSREREAVSTIAKLGTTGFLTTMDFTYRVQSGDVDEDGISVPAGALRANQANQQARIAPRHGTSSVCNFDYQLNLAHPAYGPFSGHRIYAAGTPGAPDLDEVTVGVGVHDEVAVRWTAPTDNGGSAITGYRIEHSGDGGLTWEASDVAIGDEVLFVSAGIHLAVVTGLSASTTYRFRVSARNANGVGVPSAVLEATTPCPAPPAGAFWSACLKVGSTVSTAKGFTTGNTGVLSQPTVSHGGVSYRVIELLVGNDGSMGLKFHPLLRNAANWVLLVDDRTFAISDSNHPSGNTNTFEWSNTGLSWTVGQTVTVGLALGEKPGAPTGLRASANGATQIDLSWTAPAEDGGVAVTDYKIEVCAQATAAACDTETEWSELDSATVSTATNYAHTGLTAGTTRHYRVSAVNSAGTGAASAVASGTTAAAATCDAPPAGAFWSACLTVGGAPGGYRGYSGTVGALSDPRFRRDGADYTIDALITTSTQLSLSFTGALGDAADDWVLRVGDSSYAFADADSVTTDSHTVKWQNPGFFWNSDNVGDIVTVSLSGPAPAAPGQVTGVSVTAQPGRLAVSWTAVSGADGYKVQWKSGTQDYDAATRERAVGGGATTSDTIPNLTAGTAYTVRVLATRTGAPDGAASAERTGTPLATTVAPPSGSAVWSATLTIGHRKAGSYLYTQFGYDRVRYGLGALSGTELTHGGRGYTVERLMAGPGGDMRGYRSGLTYGTGSNAKPVNTWTPMLMLGLSAGLGAGGDALVLYFGGHSLALGDAVRSADGSDYAWPRPAGLSWQDGATVAVRLAAAGGAANRAATGYPALAATAQVGHALEAGLGAIADGDGLTRPSWRYQWLVENRPYDGPRRAIEGATGAAYTPVAADEGRWLGVRVRFTDDAGHEESAVSPLRRVRAAPVAPSAANPVWSATLTAERQWEGDYDLRVGYDRGDALGALSEPGFTHGGNDYAVRRLMMTSEGASDGARALMLHLSRGLGGGGDGLVLHIGARAFALGDAQRSADGREYAWADPGRWTWLDGERALVSLALASGRATQAPLAGFVLFDNAAGGADVAALSPGAVLDGLASERLNVRAETAAGAEVGSVKLALSGARSASRTENLAPYALFGDRGGQAFPSGTYTLTATPYAEANLGGAPGPALSMTFTVAAADRTAPSVTVTSGAQGPVSGEFEVTVAFSEPVSGFRMSELAIVNGSASLMASVSGGRRHTVRITPDEGAEGEIAITVPAGVAADAAGNPNTASETLRIALAPPPPRVTGFTLFDHAAGRDVAALTAGVVLPAQSSDRLNIRAEVAGAAGSVGLALSGRASAAGTENAAPWYLFGDLGNRGARAFPAGTYTVTATPYREANLGGTAGRALSVTFRVKAHELAVADARAEEGRDETIDFAVTLAPASPAAVTVAYATADGSATAGEDYTAASGTLVFAPGETSKTVAVPVLDDAIDEGEETFTLTLSDPSGAALADAEAVGTITNSDPLQKMWLSRFGRTVASHVTDAVSDRLANPLTGAQVTVGGQRVDLAQTEDGGALLVQTLTAVARVLGASEGPEPGGDPGSGPGQAGAGGWPGTGLGVGQPPAREISGRELLLGSAFHLAREGDGGGPGLAAWGRVTVGGFDGEAPAEKGTVRIDGDVTTGILGADAEWNRLLAGVAISVSEGEGTFAQPGVDSGTIESTMTVVSPYARLALTERVSAWGLAGWGTGDMTIVQAANENQPERVTRTDLEMRLAAVGGRGALLEADEAGGIDLALKADAFYVETESEAVSNEGSTTGVASRVRLALEGGRAFDMGDGATLRPSLELGLRHDGGDAETGTGVELGGRIRYADAGSGLTVEANARTLVAHEDSGYREWGAGGSVRLDPGASGRGLSLSLAPVWGTPSSGVERLWSARDAAGLAPGGEFEAERRLEGELGYGLAAFGGAFTGTPNIGFGLSDNARDYRLGWRLTSAVPGDPGFEVSLDATRREAANENAEHGAMLRAVIRW